jgi:hypothetical protein
LKTTLTLGFLSFSVHPSLFCSLTFGFQAVGFGLLLLELTLKLVGVSLVSR